MDRRTIFLQQLLQVQDMLQVQRNMIKGLGALIASLYGHGTGSPTFNGVAATLPPNTLPTPGTNLRIVAPALTLMKLADGNGAAPAGIDTSWPNPAGPGSPVAVLGADSVQTMIQGLNFSTTIVPLNGTPDSALAIGAGNSQYFLVQAQINYPSDTTNTVLPYQSLIQTITSASVSTVSKIYLTSTAGFASGDQIIVSGFAAAANAPVFVSGAPGSDGGGPFINISPSLTSAPGTGVVVRDVNPNSGAPLNGPANSGTAQPIDRIASVTLSVKAGVASATPAKPAADNGFTPLWMVGPLANGATSVTGGQIVIATDNTNTQTAPLFPALIGTQHHKGLPGQSAKIDMVQETSYTPVNKAGDAMTGGLTVPSLVDSGPATISGLLTLVTAAFSGLTPQLTTDGVRVNLGGFPLTRFARGSYTGIDTVSRPIAVGFAPVFVIVAPTSGDDVAIVVPGSGSYFNVAGQQIRLAGFTSNVGSATATGFNTGDIFTHSLNQSPNTYFWFAWG